MTSIIWTPEIEARWFRYRRIIDTEQPATEIRTPQVYIRSCPVFENITLNSSLSSNVGDLIIPLSCLSN
jgi:hypothetical protein